MKRHCRIVAVLLCCIMLLPAYSFAASNGYSGKMSIKNSNTLTPVSIKFTPIGDYKVYEDLYGEDDDEYNYKHFYSPEFQNGDVITVTYNDNSSVDYTYDSEEYDFYYNGEYIPYYVGTEWVEEQSEGHVFDDGDHQFRVYLEQSIDDEEWERIEGCEALLTAKVVSIDDFYVGTDELYVEIDAFDNNYGYLYRDRYYDDSGNVTGYSAPYFSYYLWRIAEELFDESSTLTIEYKDNSSVIYNYKPDWYSFVNDSHSSIYALNIIDYNQSYNSQLKEGGNALDICLNTGRKIYNGQSAYIYINDTNKILDNGIIYALSPAKTYAFVDDTLVEGTVTLPSSKQFKNGKTYPLTTIENSAFWGNEDLTNIIIPDSVTTIKAWAFTNTGLKSVEIPSSVKTIQNNAFGYRYDFDTEVTEAITGFTIRGVKGSAAEEYAKNSGFAFVDVVEEKAKADAEAKAKADAEARAKADAEARAKADAEAKAKAAALAKASNINKGTVSASDIKKASNLGATEVTLGVKVRKINKNAFKGTNIKTVTVKTKKLKAKSVKGSLKGSKVKTIKVKVGKAKENKKYKKIYKKFFTKKNAGKKVAIK